MISARMRTVAVLAVVYIDMLGIGLAYPIMPKLIEQFEHGNVSRASITFGLLSGVYSLMQFLLAPLLGALSDKYGRRPIILIALLGMGLNYVLLGLAPNLLWLAAGRVISGAMGASFSTANAYLADITPPEKRAQSFGLIGAAFGFGFITGPVLGGLLGAIDLHLPFLAAAGLSFVDLVFTFFVLPESLDAAHRKEFAWSRANPLGALRELGRYGDVAGLMAVYILAMFANRVSEMTWVLFSTYRFHWGPKEIGFSLAAVGLMFVVGQGFLVRLLLPRLGERRAIVMGLLVSAVLMAGYGLITQGWMIYPLIACGVFGWVIAQPAVMGIMSKSVPANEQGLLQGALASLTSLTSIVGPPIWTGLFGYFVSPAAPIIIPGAAFFASAFVFVIALLFALRWLSARKPVAPA
ncbi:MAG TPA: TCR/Tet family MFS transporter [Rhizomicrobium sp.]|jgi:DHA1 family tetracycline resistance protein-like MFS transporter